MITTIQLCSGHRSLPTGVTCGSQFSSPNTPLVIPNPKISWANYAIYTCEHPISWYEAVGDKDDEFKFTITVPVIKRFENVRMTAIIIGEGLPALESEGNIPQEVSQYILDNNLGGVVFKSPKDQSSCDHITSPEMKSETSIVDSRCNFYEPFGGSNLWVVMDRTYALPTTTSYKIAVYEENMSTAKASFACCDWPEDFMTQFEIPESTCEACGTQASNPAWSSLFFEHKTMEAYGGYPPLQNCATNESPIDLPSGDECPSASGPGETGSGENDQPESCDLGCSKDGECHSHNALGECTHALEWSLSPKFGEADVAKVIIFKGDKIRFTAAMDQLAHNLYELKDEDSLAQCSFDGASSVAGVEEISIGHEVVFNEAGTFHFACAIGCSGTDFCHCAIGQKLTVEVKDATDGLRCHAHDVATDNSTASLPLECQDGTFSARIVNDATYGATSENDCSETCVSAVALSFMPGFETGSCADIGFNVNPTPRTMTVSGSPFPVEVVIANKVTTSKCHCHSYEEISCAEDDALYAEHIEEIEEYCTEILDGSNDVCPYKCFQPIEVLHLHYLECPSREKDLTYLSVEALDKCHIAADAPGGSNDCNSQEKLSAGDEDPTSSSASIPFSIIAFGIYSIVSVLMI
eukprot:12005967-Ditylum_brightwellii.AAC.1